MLATTAKSDDEAPALKDRLGKAAVVLALISMVLLVVSQPPSVFNDRLELAASAMTTTTTAAHLYRGGFLAMRKVVVFSLFGDRRMDRDGALANSAAVPLYYPTWTPVFVVDDSIPAAFRTQLAAAGAVVVVVNGTDWGEAKRIQRYLVLADPGVQYALFRDADSRISAREIAAVNAWLQTNRTFHVMRDHPNHVAVMLGGVWGADAAAVRRRLGDVRQSIVEYVERRMPNANRGTDQDWLSEVIWPLVGDDVVDHDAFHCGQLSPYSTPFPLPRDYHGEFVGLVQDTSEDGNRNPEHVPYWSAYREHGRATFKHEAPEACRLQPQYICAARWQSRRRRQRLVSFDRAWCWDTTESAADEVKGRFGRWRLHNVESVQSGSTCETRAD